MRFDDKTALCGGILIPQSVFLAFLLKLSEQKERGEDLNNLSSPCLPLSSLHQQPPLM